MTTVSPEKLEEGKKTSTFSWRSVNMTVDMKKEKKIILDGISGSMKGGEVCALMGPSGAGKTSLLNVLAGRVRSRGKVAVNGSILLDGNPISGSALRKRIAYVMQMDVLTPTQTVRESLWFSANLRLPKSYSKQDKLDLVDKMLKDLGLEKCADTYIGDDMIRGVSGGEKKRTCVGIELIMKPKLIFLDEPTSGLDSYAAHNVVQRLKEMAHHDGCNVLCTIHQPSSEARVGASVVDTPHIASIHGVESVNSVQGYCREHGMANRSHSSHITSIVYRGRIADIWCGV